MPQYQLFVHEENNGLTYLEANTKTYIEEKEQLLNQGFIIDTTYYIQAESGAEALAQFGDITTEALNNHSPLVLSGQGFFEMLSKYFRKS